MAIQILANNYKGTNEDPVRIGRVGEKSARTVVFDLRDVKAKLGDGTWMVIVQHPGEPCHHIAKNVWESVEGYVCWDVDQTALMRFGYGRVQVEFIPSSDEEKLYKSKIWATYVAFALRGVRHDTN